MFKLKKGHQPGVYVPLRALFLVYNPIIDAGKSTIYFPMHFVNTIDDSI